MSDLDYVKNLTYPQYNKALKERDAEIERLHMVIAAAERSAKEAAIEECAIVAEKWLLSRSDEELGDAIRALKNK